MITQSFDLNLIPDSAPVVVHCDQYDKGTGRLIISLYEGEMPYTPSGTATIQGSKPDGKGFSYSATLNGNVVTANLTEQMTAVAGRVRCQIVVTESTGRTGTFVFILDVQRSALPSDTDMSESEYEFIEQAIELTGQAVTDAQGYAEDAEESAEDSEAWAVGERGGVPVSPSDPTYENNAKYWASRAQGGVRYCGSIAFASLPVTGMIDGDLYNITDDFTTDARFVEGAGITCKAGTDVAWRNDVSKWDLYFVGVNGDYVGLKGEIEISAATSLNSLTTIGNYYKTDSTVAVTDYPSGYVAVTGTANFRLTVEKMGDGSTNDIKQTYVLINRIEYVFVRQYKSGSWGSWQRILTSSSNIGELANVDSNNPSDGDYLGYNATSSKYENMPVKGITIPADVNPSGTQYGSNWLYYAGTTTVITPSTDQNYRVIKNSTAKLYYWTGSVYEELTSGGGGGGGMNTDGTNADASIVFPSDSISSGAYAKSSGGLAFCDEQAATSDLTNNLQSIPANTTTETRILNIYLNSYPVVNIWLESTNKVTATKDMTSDVTKTYNNATIRVHKEGNYIEVWATNTNSSSVYCRYTRQSYTESNHDSLSVGKATKATGDSSVATGISTEATGKASYAGGYHSSTNKDYAHAEGFSTRAEGVGAFSIGSNSAAEGNFSFAQGSDTRASSANQAAFGKYNIEDTQDIYAFLIGNGTSNTRSNALSLDWSGNLEVAGNVTAGNGLSVENIGEGLASINTTGATNTTGSTIKAGTYFYLDGVLVRALANIANGASFTLNTNYEVVSSGALNEKVIYSDQEIVIGYAEESGVKSPVYSKTFFGKFVSPYAYAHNISNLGKILRLDGYVGPASNGAKRPFNCAYFGDASWDAFLSINSTNLVIEAGSSFISAHNGNDYQITVNYTKTS